MTRALLIILGIIATLLTAAGMMRYNAHRIAGSPGIKESDKTAIAQPLRCYPLENSVQDCSMVAILIGRQAFSSTIGVKAVKEIQAYGKEREFYQGDLKKYAGTTYSLYEDGTRGYYCPPQPWLPQGATFVEFSFEQDIEYQPKDTQHINPMIFGQGQGQEFNMMLPLQTLTNSCIDSFQVYSTGQKDRLYIFITSDIWRSSSGMYIFEWDISRNQLTPVLEIRGEGETGSSKIRYQFIYNPILELRIYGFGDGAEQIWQRESESLKQRLGLPVIFEPKRPDDEYKLPD